MPDKYLDYIGLQELVAKTKELVGESATTDTNITDSTGYKISGATDHLALPSQSQMEVLEVRGNSVVRNQQIDIANVSSPTTVANLTVTKGTNGTFTISGTANYTGIIDIIPNCYSLTNGHTYVFFANCNQSNIIYFSSGNDAAYDSGNGNLFTSNSNISGTANIMLNVVNGTSYSFTIEPRLIDLTQWYGGNVPANLTAEQFLQEYGSMIPSTQDLGTLVSASGKLVNTGRNVWNLGDVSVTSNNDIYKITQKTLYLLAGSYTFKCVNSGLVSYLNIQQEGGASLVQGHTTSALTFTISTAQTIYFTFYASFEVANTNTSVYSNIMLNYGSTALPYEPYTAHTLTINKTLRSAGSAYDKLDFVAKKKKVVIGTVNLGSLNWNYSSGFFYVLISQAKGSTLNLLCSLYEAVIQESGTNLNNMQMSIDSSSYLQIKNSNYNDATAFKTAMSGVYLNYELATPTETDIDLVNYLPVYMNGTEQQTGDVPYTLVRNYDISVRDQVITNVMVDAKQEEEIQDLKENKNRKLIFTGTGQNIKTVGGFSLDGAGDIPFPSGAYHAYQLTLYANGWQPVFRTNVIISTNGAGYSDGVIAKDNGLNLFKILSYEYTTDEYIFQDIQPNASYWDGSQIQVTCPNATAVQYLEQQDEIIVWDNTGNSMSPIDTSDIGDNDTDSYFFYLWEI